MNQGSTQQRPPLPPSKVEAIKKVHGQLVDTLERIKTRLQSPSVEPDKISLLLSKQAEFTNQLNIIHDKFKDIVGPFPNQSTTTTANRSSTIPLPSRPIHSTPRPQQSASIIVPTQPSRTPHASLHTRPSISMQTTPVPRPISSQSVYYASNPNTAIRSQSTPHYQNISTATQAQKMPISMIQQSIDQYQTSPSTTSGFSAIQQLVPLKPQYQHLHSAYSATTPNANPSFLSFPPQIQPPITTFRHSQVTAPVHSTYPIVSNGNYYPSQAVITSRPSASTTLHPSQLVASPYQMNSVDTKQTSELPFHISETRQFKPLAIIHDKFISDEPQQKIKKHTKKKSIEDPRHMKLQSKDSSNERISRSTTPVLRSASITRGIEATRRANMITSTVGIQGASESNETTLSVMSEQSRGIDSIMTTDHSRILTASKSLIQIQGKNIQTFIKQICPFISFDDCMELERAVSIVAEQFIDTISSSLCQLAMLHSSPHIKTDDVYYLLEHKFGINLPFSSVSIEDRIVSLSKRSNVTTQQSMISLIEDARINSRSRKRMPLFPKDYLVNCSESTLLNRMRKAVKSSRLDKKTKTTLNDSNHSSNSIHASSDIEESIPRQDNITNICQLDHSEFVTPDESYLLNNEAVS